MEPKEGPIFIISGGQTGVDRAALDVALELGLPCGGYCPRGRWAEDGVISLRYPLRETKWRLPAVRTWANVRWADATLILSPGPLQGGTLLTWRACRALGKPHWVMDPTAKDQAPALARWLQEQGVRVLNVAGPRESRCPGIYDLAKEFLGELLRTVCFLAGSAKA